MDLEIIEPRNDNQTGSFIFFHGAARNGKWQKEMFLNFLGERSTLNHVKIIFPTYSIIHFNLLDKVTNAWFNVKKPKIEGGIAQSELSDIDKSVISLQDIISEEQRNGIPLNRIVIGGISQGGMVALHAVYRFYPQVAGCIAVSSAVLHEEAIFEAIKKQSTNPPVFMTHGVKDDVIPIEMARLGYEGLKNSGVAAEFIEFPDAEHELTKDELKLVLEKVELMLPEK